MEEQLPLITEDRSARRPRPAGPRRTSGMAPRRRSHVFQIDAETRRVGLEGVAAARATLRAAREAREGRQAA